jgi:dissimilatory sulfite reductase (desulfoviridin) alpha/beta subunit
MGVAVSAAEKKVAVVHCSGDCQATQPKFVYEGVQTCAAAKRFYGGTGACMHGCLGLGDCAAVCENDCITVKNGLAAICTETCISCGRCVKACPTEAWDVVNGYIVSFGGLFGNSISKGNTIIPFIADKEKLMEICDAAIQFFAENANAGERFKFTLDRVGWDKFEERIQEVYHG